MSHILRIKLKLEIRKRLAPEASFLGVGMDRRGLCESAIGCNEGMFDQCNVDRDILPDISLEDKVTAELAHYRALPVMPGKKTDAAGKIVHVNPLLWWRDQQEKLPIMSKLARRVLCIPATSAPSERVFSAAGLTIAHRRASLNAENAAALIFLHDSWSEIEKMEKESEASKKKKDQ